MPPPSPFREALAKLAGRALVGADLSSSQWADVPLALRERAFFSARVANAQYLQDIKDRVESILNPVQEKRADRITPTNPEGYVTTGYNPASARAELKQILQSIGYNPKQSGAAAGTLQDLGSDARINLQLKMNVESAQGYGSYLQGQAEGAIDAFPAQELFRAEDREEPRNWPTRWMQAGGQIFGGRMIDLKSSPIWKTISEFGTPYPPFDYNSGMWVRDIDREEAIALGLLGENETIQPTVAQFNDTLEASVKNLSPEIQSFLKESLGSRVVIEGGKARWAA